MSVLSRLAEGWATVSGFVGDVMGDTAYERYLARHQAQHPGHPPLDERTWWRQRADWAENHVEDRCC